MHLRIAVLTSFAPRNGAQSFAQSVGAELAIAMDESLTSLSRGAVTLFGAAANRMPMKLRPARRIVLTSDQKRDDNLVYADLVREGAFSDFDLLHVVVQLSSALSLIAERWPLVCTLATIPQAISLSSVLKAFVRARIKVVALPGLNVGCPIRIPLSVDLNAWKPVPASNSPESRILWITGERKSAAVDRGGVRTVSAMKFRPGSLVGCAKAVIAEDVAPEIAEVMAARIIAAGVAGCIGDDDTPTLLERSVMVGASTLTGAKRTQERRRYALAHFGRSAMAAAYRRVYDAAAISE